MTKFLNALSSIFFENEPRAVLCEDDEPYAEYLNNINYQNNDVDIIQTPLISIIIIEKDRTKSNATLESLKSQTYECWEAIIVSDYSHNYGDSRIRSFGGQDNISEFISLCGGDFIMIMDSGDLLVNFALEALVQNITDNPQGEAFYSDEDILVDGQRTSPRFKPDYSPDKLLSTNYIGRMFAVKTELYKKCGGLAGKDDASEFDYVLRACDDATLVIHIAMVLYSRSISTDCVPNDKGIEFVNNALKQRGTAGFATCGLVASTFHAHYLVPRTHKCEIIVFGAQSAEELMNCIDTIEDVTSSKDYHISVISSGVTDTNLIRYENALKNNKAAKIMRFSKEKSFAGMCNDCAVSTNADELIFIKSDIVPYTPDWIESLGEIAMRRDVGIVSPLVATNDNRVVSAGNIIGLQGWWGVPYYGEQIKFTDERMNSFINTQRDVSLPNFDCFMISNSSFADAGGFDESFKGRSTIVEFSIRLMWKYRRCIYTPFVKMLTELHEYPKPDINDELRAYDVLRTELLNGDRYYNRNFDYASLKPRVAIVPYPAAKMNPIYNQR